MKKRQEVPIEETWNLQALFATEEDYEKALKDLESKAQQVQKKDYQSINTVSELIELINSFEELITKYSLVGSYAGLYSSADMTDEVNQIRESKFNIVASKLYPLYSKIENFLMSQSEEKLNEIIEKESSLKGFIEDIIRNKAHRLSDETEHAISSLTQALEFPYELYSTTKLADMCFDSFKVGKKKHPLSFVLFENEYEYNPDKKIRRKAYNEFHNVLKKYHATISAAYINHVQKEKSLASLRGYESVFDYLLEPQHISSNIYHQHIDTIMEHLSPVMQKWAKLLGRVHGLKKVKYADLKVPLDPDFQATSTISEAKSLSKKALSIMGDEYMEYVNAMLDKRGIDWAQNVGKSTGGFCSSPYGAPHSFILLSWSGLLSEVFTLVHELGHAGHFGLANKYQRNFNTEVSSYVVEAPSTMNELLLANYLTKQSDDPRYKRYVISSLVGNTYYHNYVTHFLEAYYQREVYRLVDAGEGLNGASLNRIMKETLEKFWGDSVEIDDNAALTWMRQPHYYMGLYSYTYSAGLSIATKMSQRILNEGQTAIDDWLDTLRSGSLYKPVELAKIAGVDINQPDVLIETITYMESLIDEATNLSELLNGIEKEVLI